MGTRQVPRAVREAEMLAIGRRLFAERSYDAVSMDELAEAAGVTKPMVYAYFESKEGLFRACVEDATQELIRDIAKAAPPELAPDVRLWRGLLATFAFAERSPETWALVHAPSAQRSHEAVTDLLSRLLNDAAVAGGVDPAVAREANESLALALEASVRAVVNWWLRHLDEPAERHALRLMNFVWRGFEQTMRGDLWLPPPDAGRVEPAPALREAGQLHEALVAQLATDRDAVLDRVFAAMADRCEPPAGEHLDVVVEWRVGGRDGGGHDRFQLRIRGEECAVARGGRASPDAILTIDDASDFLAMLVGSVRGAALFTAGKLRVDGDIVLAARVPGFFPGVAR